MSIADFLLSPRQQRMLAPLLLHPEQSYNLTELLRLSGSGRGSGQVQIQKFIDAAVLTELRLGNQRRIRVNVDFPLYPELKSICLKSFGLAEQLRKVLRPLESVIEEAFVFGSIATGKDRADSDIDLMVIGVVDMVTLLDAIAPVEQDLGRSVHVNLYSPTEWDLLSRTDSVLAQIVQNKTIRILPHDSTV